MSFDQQSKSENFALSFEDVLKQCRSSLECAFCNMKSSDQSVEQIFYHDGNAAGFMILLCNKNWASDQTIGYGIFLERLKKHWSFPAVIDGLHSSLPRATNESLKDYMNFLIVFKDEKPLKKFIESGEIVLGQDFELLSTTNAARMSDNPDALFIYTLEESNGIGLVSHLFNYRGIKIRLDKRINEKQYGSDFSISKLGNMKLNANGDYERIIKIVDEKFADSSMTNQQTFGERVKETFQNITAATTEKVQGLAHNLSTKLSLSESGAQPQTNRASSGNTTDFLNRPPAEYHYTEPELEKHITETENQSKIDTADTGKTKFPHTVENVYEVPKTIIEPSGNPPAPLEDLSGQSYAGKEGIYQKGQQLASESKGQNSETFRNQDIGMDQ